MQVGVGEFRTDTRYKLPEHRTKRTSNGEETLISFLVKKKCIPLASKNYDKSCFQEYSVETATLTKKVCLAQLGAGWNETQSKAALV